VYLANTGIVNEAGIAMLNTAGKFAYNFMIVPLDSDFTLALLCNESL
jgi:hypothetical protein